jgi:hypothetical protein
MVVVMVPPPPLASAVFSPLIWVMVLVFHEATPILEKSLSYFYHIHEGEDPHNACMDS